MREQDLELQGTKLAKAVGWVVHKLEGGTGEPDKIYTREGRVFYVEWKREKNGVIADNQRDWETLIKASGTPHYYCNNIEQFRQVLVELERRWFDAKVK